MTSLDLRRLATIGFLLFMVGAGINAGSGDSAIAQLLGTALLGLGVLLAGSTCVALVRR